jgi:hypothetical protein
MRMPKPVAALLPTMVFPVTVGLIAAVPPST